MTTRRGFLSGALAALVCGFRGRGARVLPLRDARVRRMAEWVG